MELRNGKIIHMSKHSEEFIVKRNMLQKWRLFNAEMSLQNDNRIPEKDIIIDFDNASKKWTKNKIELNDGTYMYKNYGGMEGLLNWLYNFFR
jgi:hypothetical protein